MIGGYIIGVGIALKIRAFYAHIPARFGVINSDSEDPAALAADE